MAPAGILIATVGLWCLFPRLIAGILKKWRPTTRMVRYWRMQIPFGDFLTFCFTRGFISLLTESDSFYFRMFNRGLDRMAKWMSYWDAPLLYSPASAYFPCQPNRCRTPAVCNRIFPSKAAIPWRYPQISVGFCSRPTQLPMRETIRRSAWVLRSVFESIVL